MTADLAIYGFDTSNNVKVRVALGYKGLRYRFHAIDPSDRTDVLRLSGQHLTPVMVHDGRVLFDSAAILRYLDANFADTPKLFGSSRDEQWRIEDHELFARVSLAGPMMDLVHRRVAGEAIDDAFEKRCAGAFGDALVALVQRLGGREWLVGDRMTAADVTAGAVVWRVGQAKLFSLGEPGAALAGWVERVMRWDGEGRLD